MKRTELISAARVHLGVGWSHMGRDKINGLDCGGFLFEIAKTFDIPYVDHKGWYSMLPDGKTLVEMLRTNLVEVERDSYQVGSIIVCGMVRGAPTGHAQDFPQHVMMVTQLDPVKIIHSCNKPSMMAVVEHIIPPKWLRDTSNTFEFPGVED